MDVWKYLVAKGFSFVMIANSGKGVGHPFVLRSEDLKQKEKAEAKKKAQEANKNKCTVEELKLLAEF